MARFRVLQQSFIDNKIVEEGTEIEFDGFPGPNLEPIDAKAKKLAEQAPGDDVSLERLESSSKGVVLMPFEPNK